MGKEAIVENMLLKNYDKYYRLAFSYTHNEADAADIVQNGAYKAILNSGSLRQEAYAETWLYRIMLNEIFRAFSKNVPIPIEEVDVEEGREDVYEDLDLRAALDSLAKEDKAIVMMRYFEDMKLEDIAIVLGENLSTVKSRLYRSIQKLRVKLEDA